MPRFHAVFSVGMVAGALIGVGMVALGVPLTAHLLIVAGVVSAVADSRRAGFLDAITEPRGPAPEGARRRRCRLDGAPDAADRALVLAFSFAEGAAIDWVGIALIDDTIPPRPPPPSAWPGSWPR